MCGFAGLSFGHPTSRPELEALARRMSTVLRHRGPDDEGVWTDPDSGTAFGFRRLAILDLSAEGHQPMQSVSGRYAMMFNGEVFNFAALRRELAAAGARFRGGSDTEVVLAGFERWGLRDTIERCVGMFAMAVWDGRERALTLVRDRLGIKPLYISWEPGLVMFGSEIKALAQGPRFDRTLDPSAVSTYLRRLYVPAPHSIYAGVRKLEPGCLLTITDPGRPLPEPVRYWSLEEVAQRGLADPIRSPEDEVVAEGEALLSEAVRLRMIADVPLGALLSGGIDSSLTVALMQEQASGPVRTFTIGFDDPEHDEAAHARAVAAHLHTDHTELRVTAEDALKVVPLLPEMFDEPLADPSQIPTYLVCRLARQHVTVALSGDGGDECFAGYNRYLSGEAMLGRLESVPAWLRRPLGGALSVAGPRRAGSLYAALAGYFGTGESARMPAERAQKFQRLLRLGSTVERYRSLLEVHPGEDHPLVASAWADTAVDRIFAQPGRGTLLDKMMLADQLEYLPDDLLAKVDRASMAVSLEARVPLLDHRLVEFSWRLPRRFKVREGRGKWLLRQALYRRVPRALLDRPKVGFTVPIAGWLRGALREWALDLLAPARIARIDGLSRPGAERLWRAVERGQPGAALAAWPLLSLLAWHERWH
jgi:asparagine synthase (glutamine-hydrolysing)